MSPDLICSTVKSAVKQSWGGQSLMGPGFGFERHIWESSIIWKHNWSDHVTLHLGVERPFSRTIKSQARSAVLHASKINDCPLSTCDYFYFTESHRPPGSPRRGPEGLWCAPAGCIIAIGYDMNRSFGVRFYKTPSRLSAIVELRFYKEK